MNERIIELADKAVEDISSGPWNISDEFCKKFAELIAKECMDIIVQNREYAIEHRWPVSETANVCLYEIEQTFGVNKDGKETVSG